MPSYIYLIQDGEDIGTNIYKVGRTTQLNDCRTINRIKSYNNGSIVYSIIRVHNDNVREIERKILKEFEKMFVLFKGNEWFKGDVEEMMSKVYEISSEYKLLIEKDPNYEDEYLKIIYKFEKKIGIEDGVHSIREIIKSVLDEKEVDILKNMMDWIDDTPEWKKLASKCGNDGSFRAMCIDTIKSTYLCFKTTPSYEEQYFKSSWKSYMTVWNQRYYIC
jgi:hypothetical protein